MANSLMTPERSAKELIEFIRNNHLPQNYDISAPNESLQTIRIKRPPRYTGTNIVEQPSSARDLFGHYISSSNVTFKPKDKVKINTMGPFDGLTGYVVSFEGADKYLVSVTPKDKSSITLTFHRSELVPTEQKA
jgi:transcription antitermination factor NusG